jgi:hypothetical protein
MRLYTPEEPFSFGVSNALPIIRLALEVKVSRLPGTEPEFSPVSAGDAEKFDILQQQLLEEASQ